MQPPQLLRILKREALERIVQIYGAWHAAGPAAGYDAKAAEWHTKLPDADADSSTP